MHRFTLVFGLVVALPLVVVEAAPPRLLGDANTTVPATQGGGVTLSNGMAVGNRAVFVRDDGVHGREPWVTDGTEAGTRMLADIYPGPGSSGVFAQSFAVVHTVDGDRGLFLAIDPAHGSMLWTTDGTVEGTHAIPIGPSQPNTLAASSMGALTDRVLFAAGLPGRGASQLWVSDGTLAGTHQILEFAQNPRSGSISSITSTGDRAFIIANVGASGNQQIWVSDGTGAGTHLLLDPFPNTGPTYATTSMYGVATAPGRVFFAAYDYQANEYRLWTSDGTTAGTLLVTNAAASAVRHPGQAAVGEGTLWCNGSTANGTAIIQTDGTPAGTFYLSTTNSLSGSNSATRNGVTYTSIQSHFGIEPWVLRPAAGASRLIDVTGGPPSAYAGQFLSTSDGVFFVATGSTGPALFVTDGTAGGTRSVVLLPNSGSIANFGNRVLCVAPTSPTGADLLKIDSTGTSVSTVTHLPDKPPSSVPTRFIRVGSGVVFAGADGGGYSQLFRTDGVAVTRFTSFVPAPVLNAVPFTPLGQLGGRLLFFANGDAGGAELWITDGTGTGTSRVKDINPGSSNSADPYLFSDLRGVELNGVVLFPAKTAAEGWELWRSDGTEVGTQMLVNLWPGTFSSTSGALTKVGSVAFFVGITQAEGSELWKTDGTPGNTVLVKDIEVGSGWSSPKQLTAWGSRLAFAATTTVSGQELYVSDGTAGGTTMVADVNPGAGSSNPGLLTASAGYLFFTAEEPGFGRELYRTDGTGAGTIRLTDVGAGPESAYITEVVSAGAWVFFNPSRANGRELWISDGTVAGTRRVTDAAAADVSGITRIGDRRVVFSASSAEFGYELWESDGTEIGTKRVSDVAPGGLSSFPTDMYFDAVSNRVFFSADDNSSVGREPWVWDVTPHCPCDLNGDGVTTLQDLFDYLGRFFDGRGDITGDGVTGVGDVFGYLECWFGGC